MFCGLIYGGYISLFHFVFLLTFILGGVVVLYVCSVVIFVSF